MPDSPALLAADAPASVAELSEILSEFSRTRTPARIVGAGSWLHAGRPVHAAHSVSTRALSGVVEYVPGDLVITVRSGTTLGEIADVTAEHDQWFALDPYVHADALRSATIGATVATASSGPLALGFGRIRDLTLGLSFVCGDGTPVRAGGRVVKNVAGFDLVRLAIGAWGTLGVITEMSLRLHARPAVDETYAIQLDWPDAPERRAAMLTALSVKLNTAPMLPVASALVALTLLTDAAAIHVLGAPRASGSCVLLARATGNRIRVDAMRRMLETLGPLSQVATSTWDQLRTCDIGDTTLRATGAPSRLGETWQLVTDWLQHRQARESYTILEPLRGAVRVSAHGERPASQALGDEWQLPEHIIAERLPAAAWARQPSPVNDVISQRLRAALDPARILNPGILGHSDDPVMPLMTNGARDGSTE